MREWRGGDWGGGGGGGGGSQPPSFTAHITAFHQIAGTRAAHSKETMSPDAASYIDCCRCPLACAESWHVTKALT